MRTAGSHTRPGRSSERRAALLSCATHALLAFALIWLGARPQRDAAALAKHASAAARDVIEIEIAPGVPVEVAPAQPLPATAAPPVPTPAVSRIAPVLVLALPRAPRARAATATPAMPGPTAEPAAVLSMRSSDRAQPAGERSAPVAGPDGRTVVPNGRPWSARSHDPAPIDLSPAQAARLIAPDPGPPPSSPLVLPGEQPAAPDVRDAWQPTGQGTYRLDDVAFTGRIARDGQVTIEDKPSFQATLTPPRLKAVDLEDPSNPLMSEGQQAVMLVTNIMVFDLTDWVMREAGMDPYTARKLRFLDQSRDVRAAMRVEARAEDLRDALAMLPGLLDQVWREPGLPAAERRELLFRLWDECAETGSEDLVNASRMVRATILAFIRRTVPEGSADAYTPAELESLNAARRSTQQFAPYP